MKRNKGVSLKIKVMETNLDDFMNSFMSRHNLILFLTIHNYYFNYD